MTDPHLWQLLRVVAGEKAAADLAATLKIDRTLLIESAGPVSRGVFAMALAATLFHELLSRVPTGAAYVGDRRRQRERIVFDHAALRTIRLGSRAVGSLPAGAGASTRILEPLGYHITGAYPLDHLGMTGRVLTHREFPEAVPQFFVSELHAERFSKEFQSAAERVFSGSREPLNLAAHAALAEFADQGRCDMKLAATALGKIVAAFARHHDVPSAADYRILLAESPEAAWIATEGATINHAADRVTDVAMTACAQRSLGRPVNDTIETSAAGTVRQTSFKADPVRRSFRAEDGSEVELTVPGSFFEFISRAEVTGSDGKRRLDLSFVNPAVTRVLKKTAAG
jgi:hypothetical protein